MEGFRDEKGENVLFLAVGIFQKPLGGEMGVNLYFQSGTEQIHYERT